MIKIPVQCFLYKLPVFFRQHPHHWVPVVAVVFARLVDDDGEYISPLPDDDSGAEASGYLLFPHGYSDPVVCVCAVSRKRQFAQQWSRFSTLVWLFSRVMIPATKLEK